MYRGVPSALFVCVRLALFPDPTLLIPKSRSLTKSASPSLFTTKQLDGFMSRWMIPASCATWSPRSAWTMK